MSGEVAKKMRRMIVREERLRTERNEAEALLGTAQSDLTALRAERDQWKRAAEGDRDGLVTHAYHLQVVEALVAERKKIEAAVGLTPDQREEILYGPLESPASGSTKPFPSPLDPSGGEEA